MTITVLGHLVLWFKIRGIYDANITDGTLIRAEEGPKVLASPPTAQMAQAFLSLAVAIYTLGGNSKIATVAPIVSTQGVIRHSN